MAPNSSDKAQDFGDRPLADFFWIAGVDAHDLTEAFKLNAEDHGVLSNRDSALYRTVDETIQEDAAAEERALSIIDSPGVSIKHSRQDSHQIPSRHPSTRSSVNSFDRLSRLSSVKSNSTVRRVATSSHDPPSPKSPNAPIITTDVRVSALLSDADLEKVLRRFTKDRDAFYFDLSVKSEISPVKRKQSVAKPRLRTQRIVAEELDSGPSPSRTLGSVRRRMSFKDLNSAKRQPSIARRQSTRSARRMSCYNSVMPMPQSLQYSSDQHPLERPLEPVLLDRYPRPAMSDEYRRRDQFPDYVPMFAFPNDIHIISSDTRPTTKWHEFFLTASDNSKRPAVCVIIWVPLDRKISDDIERKCQEWRRAHMTEAEKELAASLDDRLAAERAKLSRLLAILPAMESGTDTRDDLEDEIAEVEEKIAIMSDMLKPLRSGVTKKIEGLTDGSTGLWVPRAYGIMGRDQAMVSFWKEWLKAVVVPMLDGAILRVPASSPKVGMWQPLERYVKILCTQALQPMSSKVQVEVAIRELRLYARVEARNELPGSRTLDLYPLFRCLTVPNIVVLMEYILSESRIILVSSHTSMLKLASNALLALLWPLEWSGVHIPVVPTRLMEVLDAPIPYICGIVRNSENLNLPQDDDFLMVDLDKNELHATAQPFTLPRQQRRKLVSLLHLAAPLHQTRGVPTGPPAYAQEAFPHNMFVSENASVFSPSPASTRLGKLASLSSTNFGANTAKGNSRRHPIFNAFIYSQSSSGSGNERPGTASTARRASRSEGSDQASPAMTESLQNTTTFRSKTESPPIMQASLREKRSGRFDRSRHNPSLPNIRRQASIPLARHAQSMSHPSGGKPLYATSMYSQSTMAASTIMPGVPFQEVQNTSSVQWQEGHCLQWNETATTTACSICNEKSDDGLFQCVDCPVHAHTRCLAQICLPCPAAFSSDQVRAAFARFYASLFYNYRRFMTPADAIQKRLGLLQKFDVDAWIRTLPPEHAEYLDMLKDTQSFDEFVNERETANLSLSDSVQLFDGLMAAKRTRTKGFKSSIAVSLSGRNPFAGRFQAGGVSAEYLTDNSTHIWRTVSTPHESEKPELGNAAKGRDYRKIVSRTPGKLEDDLFTPLPPPIKRKKPSVGGQNYAYNMPTGLAM